MGALNYSDVVVYSFTIIYITMMNIVFTKLLSKR